jgi:putative transposase
MCQAGIEGVYRRKKHWTTRRDPRADLSDDLVNRQFSVDRPDALWVGDVTEHPTAEGKVYLATVIDAYSRRAVGWSIADHLRAELVVDALQMAIWRRHGRDPGTVIHTDHGSTAYTSWAFGRRLRAAGILSSMGTVGDALDNAMAESFFGTLQLELLDRRHWETRAELASAIFEYIEAFYNPKRRHSSLGYLTPSEFEDLHSPQPQATLS